MELKVTTRLSNLFTKVKVIEVQANTRNKISIEELEELIRTLDKKRIQLIGKKTKQEIDRIPEYFIMPYVFKPKISFFAFKGWGKQQKKASKDIIKRVKINFQYNSGISTSFWVVEKLGGFRHNMKTYLFDDRVKYPYEDPTTKEMVYSYDFYEDIPLPIKRGFNIDLIKETIKASGVIETGF